MITKARSPRWRMRRSCSRASHSGQPSVRGPLRYSIRQGAHNGCGASGAGRSSSGTVELLAVVVFDTMAEVVQLPGGAVADVTVALIEAMGVDEASVRPQLDRGGPGCHRLRLNQADQPAPQT